MRTLPAAAVALPGRRRFGASGAVGGVSAPGAAPTLSVQDTRIGAPRLRVSWTLNLNSANAARAAHRGASTTGAARALPAAPAPGPAKILSVQDTRIAAPRLRVPWTPRPQRPRGSAA
ncbi:hypothetical protein RKD05_001052 [Microbacterium sp. SLBN-111]